MKGTPRGPEGSRIRKGDPIRAGWLNQTRELAERGVAAGAGVYGTTVDGRTVLRAPGQGGLILKTPANGIAAATINSNAITPGTAECTLMIPTAAGWDASSVTITAHNIVNSTVAGSIFVQAKVVDGRAVVDVEPC